MNLRDSDKGVFNLPVDGHHISKSSKTYMKGTDSLEVVRIKGLF